MPTWIQHGYAEYAKRLPRELTPQLLEISLAARSKSTTPEVAKYKEGQQILVAVPVSSYVIALDVNGKKFSTEQVAMAMEKWRQLGQNICFLIGGPDGLASECIERANEKWSLSAMTFPHSVVRIMLIEQIYRAWTILHNHPYHK